VDSPKGRVGVAESYVRHHGNAGEGC
jgi:hypothetical protein